MAAGAGAIRAGLAVVEIGGDTGPLKTALGAATEMLNGYATAVAKLGAGIAAVGAAITAPLTGLFKEAVEGAKDAGTLGFQLGLTAEKASALAYAFGGGEEAAAKLAMAARKLNNELASANEGNTAAIDSFLKLGLSWQDLAGMSFDERIITIGTEIAKLKNDFDRTDQAVKFFGRNGLETLKLFEKGGAGLHARLAEAGVIGAVVTTEQADQAKMIAKAWGQIANATKFAFLEVGRALFPLLGAVQEHAATVMAVARTTRLWISDNKELVVGAFAVGTALTVVGTALVAISVLGPTVMSALVAPFVLLKGVALAAISSIALMKVALLGLLSPLSLVAGAVVLLGGLFLTQTEAGQELGSTVGTAFGEIAAEGKVLFAGLRDTAISTWAEIAAALRKGDIRGAATAALAGLNSAFAQIATSASAVWEKIADPLRDAFAKAWEDIKGRGIAVLSGVGKGLAIGGAAAALSASLSPLTGPIVAIQAAMGGLGHLFVTQTETGKRWGSAVGEAARSAGQAIKDGVVGAYEIVAEESGKTWAGMKSAAIGTASGVASAIKRGDWASAAKIAWLGIKLLFAEGMDFLSRTWDRLTQPAREAFARVKEQVSDLVADIREIITPIVEMFKQVWDDTIDTLSGWYETSVGKIKDLYETGKGWFEGLSDEWKGFLTSMAGPVAAAVAGVIAAFDFLRPYWEQLTEGLGDNWSSIFSRLQSITLQIFADMLAGMLDMASQMAAKIGGTRAAQVAGVSGVLTLLAGELGETSGQFVDYSAGLQAEQSAREAARREEKAAKKAEREQEEEDARTAAEEELAIRRGLFDDALAAEKAAAAEAMRAAEAEAKRKAELYEDALAAQEIADEEFQAGAAARAAGTAAGAVKGTFGANLTGGSAAQMFAVGEKVGASPLEKKADTQIDLLTQIRDRTEGPEVIE